MLLFMVVLLASLLVAAPLQLKLQEQPAPPDYQRSEKMHDVGIGLVITGGIVGVAGAGLMLYGLDQSLSVSFSCTNNCNNGNSNFIAGAVAAVAGGVLLVSGLGVLIFAGPNYRQPNSV
jgi:hypothetical protein